MTHERSRMLVLAVHAFRRGFAFVLFEGVESPFDWGIKEIRGRNRHERTIDAVRKILEKYRPDVLVIDNVQRKSTRTLRIRKLYRALVHLACSEQIEVMCYTRSDVLGCFVAVGATSKFEIANAIARHIPAFAHRLPKRRSAWTTEDPRQSLFDAAALGVSYYCLALRSPYLDDMRSAPE